MARTPYHLGPDDRRRVEEAYLPLRRFAAVVAPWEVDPDDLLQEAFVRTLQARPLTEIEDLRAYLRRAMLNLASNLRREMGSHRAALSRVAGSAPGDEADSYPSDLDGLRRLTPRARAIVFLAEIEGFPYDEIGQMLGCSTAAARMEAMRARRRLRGLLALEEV